MIINVIIYLFFVLPMQLHTDLFALSVAQPVHTSTMQKGATHHACGLCCPRVGQPDHVLTMR